jgi:pyruvate kinase
MKQFNRTKIIATLGPVSNSKEVIKNLILAGVNVFRLNFSHGDHSHKLDVIKRIKAINDELGGNVGILADLQGPKIRLGKIEGGKFRVQHGDRFVITTNDVIGNKEKVSISYKEFPNDVASQDIILLDDGKLELKVISTDNSTSVEVEALQSGDIGSNKGINLPNTAVSLPSLTEKDREDLEFAIKHEVDWLALSFVRSANDINELRQLIVGLSNQDDPIKHTKIIAKIEKPQAVENIDAIIDVTDGVMIARGDLGVESAMEDVPLIQKDIVQKCIVRAKPVIIATQMMESMITNIKPTRAEVTDVANAIIDGADAVMLSGETAMGKYPVEVVTFMKKIISRVELDHMIYNKDLTANPASDTFFSDAVCYNACKLAGSVHAHALIGMTRSGYTAYMVSSYRPHARIFVFTDNRRLLNRLSMVWGVKAFYYDRMVSTDETIEDVHNALLQKGFLDKGDVTVNMASMPLHKQGRTNMVKVTKIE